MLLKTRKRT